MASPFCRPAIVPVKTGLATPKDRLASLAVTVNGAVVTVRVPLTCAMV